MHSERPAVGYCKKYDAVQALVKLFSTHSDRLASGYCKYYGVVGTNSVTIGCILIDPA